MNRLAPRFLCSLVAIVLLPVCGFGVMDPVVAQRLRQSINDLQGKIAQIAPPAPGTAAALFLQNLNQLLVNLNNIHGQANAPAGHLDVATISANLHNGLQQSAFTDSRGQFNVPPAVPGAVILNPGHPASPFTVNSGRSTNLLTDLNFNPGREIPLLANVSTNAHNVNATLGRYFGEIYDSSDNPHGTLYLRPTSAHPIVSSNPQLAVSFRDNILNNAPLHINAQANLIALTIQGQADIIRQLYRDQENFSGAVTIRTLEPGEILVRCCQQNSQEPGGWWVKIQDMPLSMADVRVGIAVLPEWNQNGNLEFFVVPEGSNIVVLEGLASSQELTNINNYGQLGMGQHITILRGPNGAVIGLQFPAGWNHQNLNTRWLAGGVNQIAIVGNWDLLNNRPGSAFQGCYQAIAIIETEFDVELL